jgi:hypothetical protein
MVMNGRIMICLCLTALLGSAGSTGCSAKQEKELRQTAVVSFIAGTVDFKGEKGSDWHAARVGFRLEAGDAIRTGPDSRAEIQTRGPHSLLRVGENTTFVLHQADTPERKSLRAFLLGGNLWGRVRGLKPIEQLSFESPMAVASVRGTTLRMEVAGDTAVSVYAYEGTVEVKTQVEEGGSRKTATFNLGQGQFLLVSGAQPAQLARISAGDGWRNGWQPKKPREIEEEELSQPVPMRIEEKPRPRQVPTAVSRAKQVEQDLLEVGVNVFSGIRLKLAEGRYLGPEEIATAPATSFQEIEVSVLAKPWDLLAADAREALLNRTFYTLKSRHPDITRFVTLKFSDRRKDLSLEYARYAPLAKEPKNP